MNEVLNLVQQHGSWFYLITFFWTAFEGETFVIFAALLAAQRGVLSIEFLFLAAWLAASAAIRSIFISVAILAVGFCAVAEDRTQTRQGFRLGRKKFYAVYSDLSLHVWHSQCQQRRFGDEQIIMASLRLA